MNAHRVLFVGSYCSWAGKSTPQASEELAAALAQRGWTTFSTSRKVSRLARVGDMLTTAWVKRADYDLAHVDVFSGNAFLWAEAVCRVLRRARRPYVLTLHGGDLPRFARRHRSRVTRLLNSAVVVTTPSAYLGSEMSTYRSNLRLIPNAIHIDRYPFRLRDSLKPRLLWLRGFHALYNPEMAVESVALLVPEFPDIHLTMVGPDKGDGSLSSVQRAAERLGVVEHVTLVGPVSKRSVPDWLDRNDIFLNTAVVDNTPVSVCEAMASGLCVVSTDVGGLPHLLTHGRDALLVPPDRATDMAEAVRRILLDPRVGVSMSRASRQKAESLDWAVVLPQWETLLGSLSHTLTAN